MHLMWMYQCGELNILGGVSWWFLDQLLDLPSYLVYDHDKFCHLSQIDGIWNVLNFHAESTKINTRTLNFWLIYKKCIRCFLNCICILHVCVEFMCIFFFWKNLLVVFFFEKLILVIVLKYLLVIIQRECGLSLMIVI